MIPVPATPTMYLLDRAMQPRIGAPSRTTVGKYGDSGHYITLHSGDVIFIADGTGTIPPRIQAEIGAKKRFSRAGLQRALIEHHRNVTGESGGYTDAMDQELTDAAGSSTDAFRFYGKLPADIRQEIAANPALGKPGLFTVTQNKSEAHGEDAYGALGDRYIQIAEAKAGSPLRAALKTAKESQDPEIQHLAAVHENLPDDPAALKARATKLRKAGGAKKVARADRLEALAKSTPGTDVVKAGGLRVGDRFTHGGQSFRVAEDQHGLRVLHGPEAFEGTPIDAISHVPIDRGSFRGGALPRRRTRTAPTQRDDVPFAMDPTTDGFWLSVDEPRVPAGSAGGGQWTSGGAAANRTPDVLLRDGGKRDKEAFQKADAERTAATEAKSKDARIDSDRNEANRKYIATGRNHAASRIAEHADGRVVRVDTSDPADVAHFEARGFKVPLSAPPPSPFAADPSRQFGLFAKDASGNPAEIGEKAGQAFLPGFSGRSTKPAPKSPKLSGDESGQGFMFSRAETIDLARSSGPVYFRTIDGEVRPFRGKDPNPAESARWEKHRAAEIHKAMRERKSRTVHVRTKSGSHIIEADAHKVHHTDPAGKTTTEHHNTQGDALKAASRTAAHVERKAHQAGRHVATESAIAIDEEVAQGVKDGHLSVPTQGGEIDPHLAEAYERHAKGLGHDVGEWKIDRKTGLATATLTKMAPVKEIPSGDLEKTFGIEIDNKTARIQAKPGAPKLPHPKSTAPASPKMETSPTKRTPAETAAEYDLTGRDKIPEPMHTGKATQTGETVVDTAEFNRRRAQAIRQSNHTGNANNDLEAAAKRVGQKVLAQRAERMRRAGQDANVSAEPAHGQRLRIADLRKEMPGHTMAEQDAAIMHHTMRGNIVPESIDDPRQITKEDREQAFTTPSGHKREIAYWTRPFAESAEEPGHLPTELHDVARSLRGAGMAKIVAETRNGTRVNISSVPVGRVTTEGRDHVAVTSDGGTVQLKSIHRVYVNGKIAYDKGDPTNMSLEPWHAFQPDGIDLGGAATVGKYGDPGYYREIQGETVFIHGTPGHGFFKPGEPGNFHIHGAGPKVAQTDLLKGKSKRARVVTQEGTHSVAIHPERNGKARVIENSPRGGFTATTFPDEAKAITHAHSRIVASERQAKDRGSHLRTEEQFDESEVPDYDRSHEVEQDLGDASRDIAANAAAARAKVAARKAPATPKMEIPETHEQLVAKASGKQPHEVSLADTTQAIRSAEAIRAKAADRTPNIRGTDIDAAAASAQHEYAVREAAQAGKIDWDSPLGKQHAADYPDIAAEANRDRSFDAVGRRNYEAIEKSKTPATPVMQTESPIVGQPERLSDRDRFSASEIQRRMANDRADLQPRETRETTAVHLPTKQKPATPSAKAPATPKMETGPDKETPYKMAKVTESPQDNEVRAKFDTIVSNKTAKMMQDAGMAFYPKHQTWAGEHNAASISAAHAAAKNYESERADTFRAPAMLTPQEAVAHAKAHAAATRPPGVAAPESPTMQTSDERKAFTVPYSGVKIKATQAQYDRMKGAYDAAYAKHEGRFNAMGDRELDREIRRRELYSTEVTPREKKVTSLALHDSRKEAPFTEGTEISPTHELSDVPFRSTKAPQDTATGLPPEATKTAGSAGASGQRPAAPTAPKSPEFINQHTGEVQSYPTGPHGKPIMPRITGGSPVENARADDIRTSKLADLDEVERKGADSADPQRRQRAYDVVHAVRQDMAKLNKANHWQAIEKQDVRHRVRAKLGEMFPEHVAKMTGPKSPNLETETPEAGYKRIVSAHSQAIGQAAVSGSSPPKAPALSTYTAPAAPEVPADPNAVAKIAVNRYGENAPWVAKITGTHERFGMNREFIEPHHVDTSQANESGSMGVAAHYHLPEGVYEMHRPMSFKTQTREYFKVKNGVREPMFESEAKAYARSLGDPMRNPYDMSRGPECPRFDSIDLGAGPHKFSSTQVNLPAEAAARVRAMAARIPDEHLAEDGRETEPHVTVKYGLHDDEPSRVRRVLAGEPPFKIRMGKTSVFPASGDHQYDVVKMDVDTLGRDKTSPLRRLNKNIADAVPHTDTYSDYHPHVTVAYVKPGMGKKYAGMDDMHGLNVDCDHVEFSAKDGTRTKIPLQGMSRSAPEAPRLELAA